MCIFQASCYSSIFSCLQDGGSLDLILTGGRIPVEMIGKITVAVS